MPADIRSFFGGKPTATPIREKEPKEQDSKKKRGSKIPCEFICIPFHWNYTESRKVIDDSDDDEPIAM